MNKMHGQPSGWYRDPIRPNRHRYWNGHSWIGPIGENLDLWSRVLAEPGSGSCTS